MNHKYAATTLLASLKSHVGKYGDAQRHLFYHDYSILTMNIECELIVEHWLDDIF